MCGRLHTGQKWAAGRVDFEAESRFFASPDSAVSRLEKQPKITTCSIAYRSRLCARRKASFMAEIAAISACIAPLIRDILEGLT
jgi:hypothetical protein